uniref:Ig-like domain-containing protein n=1 Tax=Gasterosteus aculeatus aculeatus TaxID=481459 RepID=A0AAQ4QUQ6_GASAC
MSPPGLTKGAGVLPGPLNAAVGETVMFSTTLTPPEIPFLTVRWRFGEKVILDYDTTSANIPHPEYEGRITLFISTGSLELRNVTSNDSGQYSVIIVTGLCGGKHQNILLSSIVPVSDVTATAKTNLSIEGNSFKLSCDAGGSMISREWKKDGVKLTPDDHLSLQENNRVLTLNSLSRKDTGVYLCNVTNPVSQEEAEYKMVVYYGPENVQIKGPSDIDLKTTLTLTCSAESVPASYTWMLNSTEIHNSAVYTKDNTEPSDGGNYICEVKNVVTGRTSSALHGLSVTGAPGLSGTKMLLILLMHLIIEVTHSVSRLIILSAVGFLKVFPTVHTCW